MTRILEKIVLSESGRLKAEIERREAGAFQISIYKWTEEWVERYGKVSFGSVSAEW
jgi:hypothetical protein